MNARGAVGYKTIERYMTQVYSGALGRVPDASGLKHWQNVLATGEMTGSGMVSYFFTSQEYVNKNKTNTAFITDLYKVVMGRNPDTSGLNYWVGLLNSGTSRVSVINNFTGSDEFLNMCKLNGMIR